MAWVLSIYIVGIEAKCAVSFFCLCEYAILNVEGAELCVKYGVAVYELNVDECSWFKKAEWLYNSEAYCSVCWGILTSSEEHRELVLY